MDVSIRGGNKPDPERANYNETGINTTSAVGCFPGRDLPYGCLDMAGNVWEWTRSLWGPYPYPTDKRRLAQRENLQAPGDELRVLRGGAFWDILRLVRCAARSCYHPDFRFRFIGFRVVLLP
jgi:formylglycine-generating enzyme required for sulfatase activity